MQKIVDGKTVEMTVDEIKLREAEAITNEPPAHIKERENAYSDEMGSVYDQLDLIYWDMKKGTTEWIDKITDIKNRIPKT